MARKTDIRYSEEANNYYRSVRLRFHNFSERLKKNGIQIDFTNLLKILTDRYGLTPEPKTLQGLFQIGVNDTKSINMVLVMAVCDIFKLNITQFTGIEKNLADKNQATEEEYNNLFKYTDTNESVKSDSKDIEFIKNTHYFGEYYVYYFSLIQILSDTSAGKYQPQVNPIRESRLIIEKPQNFSDEVVATLEELTSESGNRFKFKGHAIRLLNIDKIFISLSETKNRSFIWLMFDDVVLRKQNLYFKEIAMLSHTSSAQTKPVFAKMILTKKRLDINKKEVIQTLRGILTFNQDDILIDSESAEIISNDFPEIAELFNSDHAMQFYRINKSSIINNINLKWDYHTKQKCLLKLMELSMNPVQACVDQSIFEHIFWKDLQNDSNFTAN